MTKIKDIIKNTEATQNSLNNLTLSEVVPHKREILPSTNVLFESDWVFLNALWAGNGGLGLGDLNQFSDHVITPGVMYPAIYTAIFQSEPIWIPDEFFPNANVHVQYKLPVDAMMPSAYVELPDSVVEDRYKRGNFDYTDWTKDIINLPDESIEADTIPSYIQRVSGTYLHFGYCIDYVFKDNIWQLPEEGDIRNESFTPCDPEDLYTEFEHTEYEPDESQQKYYVWRDKKYQNKSNILVGIGEELVPEWALDELFPGTEDVGTLTQVLVERAGFYQRVYDGFEWHWEYGEEEFYAEHRTFEEVEGWVRPVEYKDEFTINDKTYASGVYPVTEDYFVEDDFEKYGKVLSTTLTKYPVNQHFHYAFQKVNENTYILLGKCFITILGPAYKKFEQHDDSYGYYFYRPGYDEWWATGVLPDEPNYKVQMKLSVSLQLPFQYQTAYIRNKNE